jgi:hypothetical protein
MSKIKMKIAFDSERMPSIPIGARVRVDPIVGESGYVAAFKLIDSRDDSLIATVPVSAVTINGQKGARVRVAREGEEI